MLRFTTLMGAGDLSDPNPEFVSGREPIFIPAMILDTV